MRVWAVLRRSSGPFLHLVAAAALAAPADLARLANLWYGIDLMAALLTLE